MTETAFNDQPKIQSQMQEREAVQEPTLLQRTRQKLHNTAALLITTPVWFPVRNNEPQPDTTLIQSSAEQQKQGKTALRDAPIPHSAGPLLYEAKRAITQPNHPLRAFARSALKAVVGIKTGHYNP